MINDLSARLRTYQTNLTTAVSKVLEGGRLVLGPEVGYFEKSFAEYNGVRHCVSLANGTDAIELALRSFVVRQGDLVATVANAGAYTTIALMAIGAEPYYLDVELDSRHVTLAEVARAIDAGVEAVVVTHLYGLAVQDI